MKNESATTGLDPWMDTELIEPAEVVEDDESEPEGDGEAGDDPEGDQGGGDEEVPDEDSDDEDASEEDEEEATDEEVKAAGKGRVYRRLREADEQNRQLKAKVKELERFYGGVDELRKTMATEYSEDRVTFLRDLIQGLAGKDAVDGELRELSEDLAYELLQLESDGLPKETQDKIRLRKLERAQKKTEAQAQRQLREWQRKAAEAEAARQEQAVRGQVAQMIAPLRDELPHLFENPMVEDPAAVVHAMVAQRYEETGVAPDVLEMARLADGYWRTEVLKFERFFGEKAAEKRQKDATAGKQPKKTDGKRKGLSNAKASRTSARGKTKKTEQGQRKFNGFGWDDEDVDQTIDTWGRRFRADDE